MSQVPNQEILDLLAIRLVPGIGPRLTEALLKKFGSARAVLQASPNSLQEVDHIGPRLAQNLAAAVREADVAAELDRLRAHGCELISRSDNAYPKSLLELPDAPYLMYVRGELRPGDARAVAIVGSRSCTPYGKRVADRLAAGLAHSGYTVISGLARGIDGAAHQAALKAGGRTLAVLAGGLGRIYPPEHTELADAVATSGALLTESSMGMEPMAGMFPARNRLISVLSRGIVIVEAAQKSGALITARHAADQGRTVFAVPGAVDSVASSGTNQLIREGAILVRGVEDILEELEGVRNSFEPRDQAPPSQLDPGQLATWHALAERPRHLDELVQALGMPVSQLAGILFQLELRKLIRRLPGNQYELIRR